MKRLIFTILILSAVGRVMSQKVEAGLMGGTMFYIGDMTEKAANAPQHPAGGLFIRFNTGDWMSLKGDVLLGSVSASDAATTSPVKLRRNLSFQSNITEFSAQLEINLIRNYNERGQRRAVVPYVFGGIDIFHFNPQAYLFDSLSQTNVLYELQPLGTEGQGLTKYPNQKRYNLNSFAFPFGAGIKFHFGERFTLGLEFGMRKTMTDYLDDVSGYYAENDLISAQYGPTAARLADRSAEVEAGYVNPKATPRGNPSTLDWYGFTGVLFSYSFVKHSHERCNEF